MSASLREVPGVAWLEREQLRLAADEMSSHAVLSSEGVARRLELGQQLRADVLLLVATEAAGDARETYWSATLGRFRWYARRAGERDRLVGRRRRESRRG